MPSLDFHSLVAYLSAHPYITITAAFLAAFLEALAVIGTVIPGSLVVFITGILVGIGSVSLWWVLGAAILGATFGDGLSYWLGHRYCEQIRQLWPIRNHPQLFERGVQFFQHHGGKSIFLARFVSPVRAIVPIIAGMSDMRLTRFYTVNILSALLWVPAQVLPGVLFGAAIQLAGAVSARLVIILILALILFWLVIQTVRLAFQYGWPWFKHIRDRIVVRARSRSGVIPRFVLSLFDPRQLESKVLLLSAVILLSSAWLFLGILEDVVSHDPLVRADEAIYHLLQRIRTNWVDRVMVVITELGGVAVTAAVSGTVLVWLAVYRLWWTVVYWLAAIGFAELSVLVLKLTLGRIRPNALYTGIDQFSFPSGHATLSTTLYGFLAFMLIRKQSVAFKIVVTSVVATFIVLITFSRLYLGAHWLSDVLAGLSLGLAWVTLLGIVYIHHRSGENIKSHQLALLVIAVLAVAGFSYSHHYLQSDLSRYSYDPQFKSISLSDWQQQQWQTLPLRRSELSGEAEEPLTVQWVASPEKLTAAMEAAGWRVPPGWLSKNSFLWLLPNPPIDELPVLPKFNAGQESQLVFVKAKGPNERYVLRLWKSQYRVTTDKEIQGLPLWFGMVTREQITHPLGSITTTKTVQDWITPVTELAQDLRAKGPVWREVWQKNEHNILQIFLAKFS